MEEQGFSGLNQIGQIAVTVRDLDRAIAFYRDKLGLHFLFQVPNMAFFDCAGVRLLLSLPEGEQTVHTSSILYFLVGDIEAVSEALADRGVIFSTQPHVIAKMEDHDLWMAFYEDSEGNTMALMSEVR